MLEDFGESRELEKYLSPWTLGGKMTVAGPAACRFALWCCRRRMRRIDMTVIKDHGGRVTLYESR